MTEFYNLVPSTPKGRFDGIERPYSAEDVKRLRGSVQVRQTLAENGANRLWQLINEEDFVNALGAVTGNQAMQQVRAGLKAIYLSGWQVAADANTAGAMYPDQSLYPANAAPELVRRINRTLQRADQIETAEGNGLSVETWFAPILADAEAGFGGPLNAFEITKAFIEAGAAGYLLKDISPEELRRAVHVVAGGEALLSPSITRRVMQQLAATTASAANPGLLADLTEREREILRHIGLGESNDEIANNLYISPATARTYVSRLLAKLDARDRSQLVIIAYESGLVTPGQT